MNKPKITPLEYRLVQVRGQINLLRNIKIDIENYRISDAAYGMVDFDYFAEREYRDRWNQRLDRVRNNLMQQVFALQDEFIRFKQE